MEQNLASAPLLPSDLVVLVHNCGVLTGLVLECALSARACVPVLPCCHDLEHCDIGGLEGLMDGPLAVDATRAARLRSVGYQVLARMMLESITPKNRLLMGQPTTT